MDEKVRENRLRRMAKRQGLVIEKSRRRDPRSLDYGMWWIADARTLVLLSPELGMDIDQVEQFLESGEGKAAA